MIFIYRILINLILILSPLIILLRLLKKKEDFIRFKEKLSFFTKKRSKGKLVWFHGASVGEVQSIIPILEKIYYMDQPPFLVVWLLVHTHKRKLVLLL